MSAEMLSAIRLSIQVAVLATILNAAVGIPIAYLLARRRFWGRTALDLLATGDAARVGGAYLGRVAELEARTRSRPA